MSKEIAFVVDGHMEQKIIQHYCRGVCVRRLNCNGPDTPAETIAKHLAPLIKLLKTRRKIFVVLDREGRSISAEALKAEISRALKELGCDVSNIRIVAADRCTENWILADVEGIKKTGYIREDAVQKNYEGRKGKMELRKILNKGISYHETVEGVNLFRRIRPEVGVKHSVSFHKLTDMLRGNCRYLDARLS